MKGMKLRSLFAYELWNVLRARWLLPYGLVFGGFAAAVLQFGNEPTKAILSLQSLVLLIVPMVSILYASIYWYSNEAFTHLLLTQPLRRSQVYLARWGAVSLSLSASFSLGSGAALTFWGALGPPAWLLLALGGVLTVIFVGLGMAIAVVVEDRMKGIGLAFVLWFYCALLHDALVFLLFSSLQEYPVELPGLILMALNPIDLARVLLLLALDLSAMMGYTGRILQKTLSGPGGAVFSSAVLALWMFLPVLGGLLVFRKKDL